MKPQVTQGHCSKFLYRGFKRRLTSCLLIVDHFRQVQYKASNASNARFVRYRIHHPAMGSIGQGSRVGRMQELPFKVRQHNFAIRPPDIANQNLRIAQKCQALPTGESRPWRMGRIRHGGMVHCSWFGHSTAWYRPTTTGGS